MRRSEAERILSRITYKPGWKIELLEQWPDRISVRIELSVLDSGDRRTTIRVARSRYLPDGFLRWCTETELIDQIRNAVSDMEAHERDEWFQVDGKPIYDPHPPEIDSR